MSCSCVYKYYASGNNCCRNNCCKTTTCCQPATCQTVTYAVPQCAPACPNVRYVTNIATATTVPSGGTAIPIGTTIASGITTVPAGTVTVINGYTGAPTVNEGGITSNNGFFTVPVAGAYDITANITFASVPSVISSDIREVFIYRVSAQTNIVTQIAVDSRTPIAASTTSINVSTAEVLAAGDRVFIAVIQTNAGAVSVDTVAVVGRLSIIRF
jgi:hypothetical protein